MLSNVHFSTIPVDNCYLWLSQIIGNSQKNLHIYLHIFTPKKAPADPIAAGAFSVKRNKKVRYEK